MDKELIARIKSDDQSAVGEIIDEYGRYVSKIIQVFFMGRFSAEDMEETVSDVFVLLWKSRSKLDSARPLRPYLAAITRNAARQKLRTFVPPDPSFDESFSESSIPSPEQLAEHEERSAELHRALSTLSEQDREIFFRYYYLEQKISEISFAMGIVPSTIKSRLMRGRSALKVQLNESEAE